MKKMAKEFLGSIWALIYCVGTIVFFLILARKCDERLFLLGLFLYLTNTVMLYRRMVGGKE